MTNIHEIMVQIQKSREKKCLTKGYLQSPQQG